MTVESYICIDCPKLKTNLLAEGRLTRTWGAYFFCFLRLYFSCIKEESVARWVETNPKATSLNSWKEALQWYYLCLWWILCYLRKGRFGLKRCTVSNQSLNNCLSCCPLSEPNWTSSASLQHPFKTLIGEDPQSTLSCVYCVTWQASTCWNMLARIYW
jgi:hypothetical protein